MSASFAAPEYRALDYAKLEPEDIADPAAISDEQVAEFTTAFETVSANLEVAASFARAAMSSSSATRPPLMAAPHGESAGESSPGGPSLPFRDFLFCQWARRAAGMTCYVGEVEGVVKAGLSRSV